MDFGHEIIFSTIIVWFHVSNNQRSNNFTIYTNTSSYVYLKIRLKKFDNVGITTKKAGSIKGN